MNQMLDYYKKKMDECHKKWETAQNIGEDEEAKRHMKDFVNYQKLAKQFKWAV